VILAGDLRAGQRGYSVITQPETVQGVASLFEAAWRSATELAVYDAQIAEIRQLAPQVLDLLSQGCKDETAARALGLGVRTYRRRVAELMAALGAQSRFQAGARARELGLV
jgi:DNA-binding NarL/FixJ family response regulator